MRRAGDLVVKDPDSDEPYGFDWSDFIAELGAGSAIASSSWTITGPDATLTKHDTSTSITALIDGVTVTGHFTQLYLTGGTVGRRYTVTNRIVTNNTPPVTDDRSFSVSVANR